MNDRDIKTYPADGGVDEGLNVLAQRMAMLDQPRGRSPHVYVPPAASSTAPAMPTTTVLTLAEAAAELGVHPKTLVKWPIPFFREGRVVRIMRADLDAFIAARLTAANQHLEN